MFTEGPIKKCHVQKCGAVTTARTTAALDEATMALQRNVAPGLVGYYTPWKLFPVYYRGPKSVGTLFCII